MKLTSVGSRAWGALLLFILLGLPLALEAEEAALGSLASSLAAVRRSEGLKDLPRDLQADATAASYAADLAKRGLLSHRDARGGRAADRFAWTGRLVTMGEIIGAGENLESLVPAWLDSPGHRKILLSPRWKSWGMGLVKTGLIWVAVVLFLEKEPPPGQSVP